MSQPSSGSRRTRLRACAVTALVCLFLGLLVLVMGWIVPWRVSQALQDGVRRWDKRRTGRQQLMLTL